MRWFRRRKKLESPYHDIRELLFADAPLENNAILESAAAKIESGDQSGAKAELYRILQTESTESRVCLQAWHALRTLGEAPPADIAREVKGMVIEIGFEDGLDTVAAYSDHTARYINRGGNIIIWEGPGSPSMDHLIDDLFEAGKEIVQHTGILIGSRLSPPGPGEADIYVLTCGGIHFGRGPLKGMNTEALAGLVLQRATTLVQALRTKIDATPNS